MALIYTKEKDLKMFCNASLFKAYGEITLNVLFVCEIYQYDQIF